MMLVHTDIQNIQQNAFLHSNPSKKITYLKYIYIILSIVQIYYHIYGHPLRFTDIKIIIQRYLEYYLLLSLKCF